MVKGVLSSVTVAIVSGDDSTTLMQMSAGAQNSRGQRILASLTKDTSTICVEAVAGDVAPVAGSYIAKMSQQAVEVASGSVAPQAGSFCVPKQDVLLMQRTYGLNTAGDFEAALEQKKQQKKQTTSTTEAALGGKQKKQTTTTTTKTESLGSRLTAGWLAQNVMPQSLDEALESEDWAEVGSGSCHPKFGRRFQRKGLMTPTLMYDNIGHIAGMQFAVDTGTFPLYPDSNLKVGDYAVPTGLAPSLGDYALTTYFSDPSKICSASPADRAAGSIGDRLWVANPSAPLGHEALPMRSDDGVPGGYESSGCLASGKLFPNSPGMGTHWWRVTQPNGQTPCNEAGPIFPMYSRGRLVAMGMNFIGFDNRVPTAGNKPPVLINPATGQLGAPGDEMWEFARQDLTPHFFHQHDNPSCMKNVNLRNSSIPGGTVTLANLHVYFSDPLNITCP